MIICPNCGFQHSEEPFAPELQHLIFVLPLKEKDILVRLLKSRGATVSHENMFSYVYGAEVSGGPDSGLSTLYGHISKLRRKIAGHGWTIVSRRFDGIRLLKVAA